MAPKGKEPERKVSILVEASFMLVLKQAVFFFVIHNQFRCSIFFAEGGGKTKGEGKGKDSKHRSFYGGAEA